jgi:trk system potassium uptake protein TrkA
MKYIIIGLGSFGASLAMKLTELGHEVIGVDTNMSKVDALKESITHTMCLDACDSQAVTYLPLKDAHVVVVAIGENEGANIMATAVIKQVGVKRLISRALSPIHETVLQAMGVDEIVHPEEETAERWAKKLNLEGVLDSFDLGKDYAIVEAIVPEKYVGLTVAEVGFRRNYNLVMLTTMTITEESSAIGARRRVTNVQGVASPSTILNSQDILVVYGNKKDVEKMLNPK